MSPCHSNIVLSLLNIVLSGLLASTHCCSFALRAKVGLGNIKCLSLLFNICNFTCSHQNPELSLLSTVPSGLLIQPIVAHLHFTSCHPNIVLSLLTLLASTYCCVICIACKE